MFEKERLTNANSTTILDQGCRFEGKLTFEGSVQVKGHFKGEIFSEGVLTVGENALIEGKVEVESMIISGKVIGSIRAKKRIEMHAPAIVEGEISAPSLVIQEGAVFEGTCSMGEKAHEVAKTSQNHAQYEESELGGIEDEVVE